MAPRIYMAQHKHQKVTAGERSLLYDELPFWSAPFGMVLLDTVRIRSHMMVLDIGSGYGFPMLELAERLDSGSGVTGIDPSEESILVVKKKITARGITNAKIISGVAEAIPFGNDHFDLIVSNNGLNNVRDLPVAMKESFRVLKPRGQMVFSVNLPHTFIEFYDVFEGLLTELAMDAERGKVKEHIFQKRKSVEFFRDLILETGFNIVSFQPEGFKYRFADGTSFFNHFLIRNFFRPAWEEILPGGKVETIFAELDQRLNNIARRNGTIEMSVPFIIFDLFK